MAGVRVISLDAVGRDLDLVVALADDDRSEAVEVERLPEDLLDRFRRRARRDVPVVWVDSAQCVANAPANDEGLVPGRHEARDHALYVRWDANVRNGHCHSGSLESGNRHIPRSERCTSGEERSSLQVPVCMIDQVTSKYSSIE